VIASRVYHGVKPFYWLRSARATAHFTCSGLVETDRLTEKAEKAREGTNCIISTKAMSTVDAVEIDIDAHQDAHWWSPLFLTYPNSKVSLDLSPSFAIGLSFCPKLPSKNHRTTAFAGYNSWRGATVFRASHHGSYFISWGLDGGLHQPHWNVGTKIPTINIPITNRHRERPCPAKRATREISAFQTRGAGSTASRFSWIARGRINDTMMQRFPSISARRIICVANSTIPMPKDRSPGEAHPDSG
jgi:hypothetical protein